MKAWTAVNSQIEMTARSLAAAVAVLALVIAGCGGGGSAPATVNGVAPGSPTAQAAANAFTVTSDNYGMASPNFLAASKSSLGVVLRCALASSMTDPDFKTVSRIDIPAGFTPSGVYSLGAATPGAPAFPGAVYFFNGHQSTQLGVIGGTITFASFGGNPGDRITGSFSAMVEDGADSAAPKASYRIAANFDFATDSNGPVLPAPPAPSLAAADYDGNCASCHALGGYDPTQAGASDLALKGGKLDALFSADLPGHQGVRLSAAKISALKVLLNTN